MAITIQQSPGSKQPAYNELVYVVSSNNYTQQNFRFVADIYISGVSSPAYFRQKKSPHPTLNVGVFDIHRIVENYISHDISTTTYGFQRNENSGKQYQVKFGEEYGISSGIIVYDALTNSSSGDIFPGALGFLDYKDYSQANYILGGSTKKFLTNAPASQNIFTDENAWLYMIQETSGVISSARVVTKNAAGATIDTINIVNPYPDSDADHRNQFLRFGCGTYNLNQIDSSLLNGASQPIIGSNVASYTISIGSTPTGGAIRSETRTFVIKENCSRYDTYRIHFLNKLGGFDSFTFNMIAVETFDIARSLFKKTVGTTTATTFSYAKSDKENRELSIEYQDTLRLESDWITETEATWLEELVHSPVVFLDHATHGLIALNITKSQHTKRRHIVDKTINLQVEAKYSFNNFRQRG